MRTFKVIHKEPILKNEYISEEEYELISIGKDNVSYRKCIPQPSGFKPGSFMPTYKFKQALRTGDIIFTDV